MEEQWIVRVVFASAPLVGRVWTVQVNNIKKADGFSFFIKLYNNLIQQNTVHGKHFRHQKNNDALRCLRFGCFMIQILFFAKWGAKTCIHFWFKIYDLTVYQSWRHIFGSAKVCLGNYRTYRYRLTPSTRRGSDKNENKYRSRVLRRTFLIMAFYSFLDKECPPGFYGENCQCK